MLGLMAATSSVIPMGLLHLQPLKYLLKACIPSHGWHLGRIHFKLTCSCVRAVAPWKAPRLYQTAKVAGVPQTVLAAAAAPPVVADKAAEAAVPPVAADEAAVPPAAIKGASEASSAAPSTSSPLPERPGLIRSSVSSSKCCPAFLVFGKFPFDVECLQVLNKRSPP
ncbi:hypothetical protein G5714_001317 [Onychostoma macrolepis]|uniref:Uncharacterized protein n=1 Tax=Onychostoma macrolepis TaxID=369639 RepID=A0A7J6DD22_9TELE|nr:hypothetical protein G5714_001317 [Onychostoma macrolepis]